MGKAKKNFLISGLPGIGKTTLIKKLAVSLSPYNPQGFYTEEILQDGERKGFHLRSLGGESIILAHVINDSPHKIGKYRVDLDAFEDFLDALHITSSPESPVIIDEIGKMECLSPKFVKKVQEILDGENPVIATIAHTDGGIKGKVKAREDAELFKMNLINRNVLEGEILDVMRRLPQFRDL